MNSDHIVRATALGGQVRAFAMDATAIVEELQRRHRAFPAATAALGRTAMGALLLAAASLKEESQSLTVEIRGNGPLGRVICTANGAGEVRGLASNPQVHADSIRPGKLNVAGVVGTSGYLSVTKQLGEREPYSGVTELQSGEIGDDLAYYLAQSEQIPSAVGLGVFVRRDGSVDAAGGYLVQLLPGLADAEIAGIEQRIAALPHPTKLLKQGITPRMTLARIFPDGFEVLDESPITFFCPCSRDRFQSAIASLGRDEVNNIIQEEEKDRTEVVCHFCNEAYHFTPAEMYQILETAS
jgi:molecular chaperone Hsp33